MARTDCVLMKKMYVEKIERMAGAFNFLKKLIPAEQDMQNREFREARAYFEQFKRDHEINTPKD